MSKKITFVDDDRSYQRQRNSRSSVDICLIRYHDNFDLHKCDIAHILLPKKKMIAHVCQYLAQDCQPLVNT